jgi:hypothetical protein
VILAAALIAVPTAGAIVTVPAVAILTATGGAWLVFVGELIWR